MIPIDKNYFNQSGDVLQFRHQTRMPYYKSPSAVTRQSTPSQKTAELNKHLSEGLAKACDPFLKILSLKVKTEP